MPVKFIHTADWQIGKPFAWVSDPDKRLILQRKRIDAIKRIADEVNSQNASFVVVAGDLFDSPTPTKSLVSEVCSLIGKMKVPVFVIPGNHDHGGPLGLWDKDFFIKECKQLARNLHVLLEPEPLEADMAVILPCPLLRRHESSDPTTWIRNRLETIQGLPTGKPRIVIAHGSVQDFGSIPDEDEGLHTFNANRIELGKLPMDELDYVALGDWHGAKSVDQKAWYSGTPELDRFNKGGDYTPGKILVVETTRGLKPSVTPIPVSETRWHEAAFSLNQEEDIQLLEARVDELVGKEVNMDLMKLHVSGLTGLDGFKRLADLYETFRSRFICLRLEDTVRMQPSSNELESLTTNSEDPLTAQVASRLLELMEGDGESAEVARLALRELYMTIKSNQ
jgi:DNA repair exonuclease SbcCD nuclease subunit